MKKLSLVVLAVMMTSMVHAQFNLGIKAGVSLNSLSYNSEQGIQYETNPGFELGAMLRVYLGGKFYVQPEVSYSFSKIELEVTPENLIGGTMMEENEQIFKESQQGVNIPVLFGYRLLDLKVANLRVFAGPEFKISTSKFDELRENVENFDSKAFGVSGLAGIGVDALMLSLDLRYAYPFTNNFVIGDEAANFKGWVVSLTWKLL